MTTLLFNSKCTKIAKENLLYIIKYNLNFPQARPYTQQKTKSKSSRKTERLSRTPLYLHFTMQNPRLGKFRRKTSGVGSRSFPWAQLAEQLYIPISTYTRERIAVQGELVWGCCSRCRAAGVFPRAYVHRLPVYKLSISFRAHAHGNCRG